MFSFTDFSLSLAISHTIINLFKLATVFLIKTALYISFIDVFVLFFFCYMLWGCFSNSNFRYKVKYFLGFLFNVALFGFLSSYDGCILILLLTEFFIVLVFFLLYLTTHRLQPAVHLIPFSFKFFVLSAFIVYFFSVSSSLSGFSYQHYNIYESALDVVTSDFFIFFQFFFVSNPVLVIYCALILSFFIIFFICFYFQMKKVQLQTKKKSSAVDVLRKQNALKQAKHKAQIRVFRLNVPKR